MHVAPLRFYTFAGDEIPDVDDTTRSRQFLWGSPSRAAFYRPRRLSVEVFRNLESRVSHLCPKSWEGSLNLPKSTECVIFTWS